ncbi:hypothetical protein LCGC14_1748830 [marine sediment metagenome]|uniref:Uncharacterized protein n=1 Tax=marine sediment metagenome TaxID=412755 RepID=A0A0F9K3Y0_9ZZZZ
MAIIFGNESEFLSANGANDISAAVLNGSKFAIAYKDTADTNHGTAKIGTVSGTTITFGAETEFLNVNGVNWISIAEISESKFVVTYTDSADSSHGTAKIGTVSGTTITFGTEAEFLAANGATDISVAVLNESKFVVTYRDGADSNHGTAKIGTVSGTTITFGAETEFLSTGSATEMSAAVFNTSKFIITYRDGADSNHGTAKIGTVSGTTITFGAEAEFLSANGAAWISAATFDESKFVVAYQDGADSNHGTAKIGSLPQQIIASSASGNLITKGKEIFSISGDLVIPNIFDALQSSGTLLTTGHDTTAGAGNLYTLGLQQITTLEGPPKVYAWGRNSYGQIDVPAPNTDFIAVAGGNKHSFALRANGSIVAWGSNAEGQLDVPTPNTNFMAVAAGGDHSLGLKTDDSIVAWGLNSEGQTDVPAPNTDFEAVAAGGWHSLGLKADGSIEAWGWNDFGQCNVPAPNSGFVAIAAGYAHSLGLKADGSIVAWGNNTYGQINVPAPNTNFMAVAGGSYHSLGLKVDSSIVAWGRNSDSQLNIPAPNTNFVSLAGGIGHSLGLKANSSVVAWGNNDHGQLDVPALNTDFIAIAAGYYHSMGIKLPDISPHLFIEGNEILSTSGDLVIPTTFDVLQSSGTLWTGGFSPSDSGLALFIQGSVADTSFQIVIDAFLRTADFDPTIIGLFLPSESGVTIEIWDLIDGINTQLAIDDAICFPIGDTGRYGWSTANLPTINRNSGQYFFRMTDNIGDTFVGEFFLHAPENGI